MLFGINCHQARKYFKFVAKEDPIPTRIWLLVVMVANAASVFHQVYINWVFSIDWFDKDAESKTSPSVGEGVILYSVVIM